MRNLSLPTLISFLLATALPAAAFLPGKTGEQTRYKLTYKGDGVMNIRGMFDSHNSGSEQIQTLLNAQLEVGRISSSLLSVRLLSAQHLLKINGQTQDLTAAVVSLEHPCYLTIDAQGRVQSISFESGTPVAARSLMRSLVSGLEYARPAAAGRAWKVEQDTTNGAAKAAYRSLDSATVVKQIVDYPLHRTVGPKGMPQMRPVTEGALRFTFRQAQLQEVSGSFSTRFTLANRTLSNGTELFHLVRVSTQVEPTVALRRQQAEFEAERKAETPSALHVHDTDPVAERASWVPLLKAATPASLQQDLRAVDASGVSNDSGLYNRLCAVMTLQPETSAAFEHMLAAAQPNKLSTRLVVAALAAVAGGSQESSKVETPAMRAAERALYCVLAGHKDTTDMVLLVAPALGMAGSPRPESASLLETLIGSADRDISISCALALGSLAHNCGPGLAKTAVNYLERKLASSSEQFQQQLLAALGNSGSVDCVNTIANIAQHSSARMRAVGMMSLRLIPSDRATEVLYRGLHDADSDVRLNAARAFEFRPFSQSDIQAFKGLIFAEKIDRVRQAMLENLKLEAPYYPQAHAVLAQASKHDASSEIRKTVAGWL
jgi:hypothetical protein